MRSRPLGLEFTAAEAATVARFDRALPAEESLRERVVAAMKAAVYPEATWHHLADAAIAVMRGDA